MARSKKAIIDILRPSELGKTIQRIRKSQNLTQEQLGKRLGVQKAQISKLENSAKNVRIETLVKVLKALNAEISFQISTKE